jgi:hypothetical protein
MCCAASVWKDYPDEIEAERENTLGEDTVKLSDLSDQQEEHNRFKGA